MSSVQRPSGIWVHIGPRWVAWVFVGLLLGSLAGAAGGLLVLQAFAPGLWALPGALTRMTGRQVAHAPEPAPPQPMPLAGSGTPAALPPADQGPRGEPPAVEAGGPLLPQRRFTVLLLGSDNDQKFPAEAVLTQSMILVSIDPSTRDVTMVSIPRDFWVPIPGYGAGKIDVAYELGGIALARATVERLFGVTIDYYAWVGLNGLVDVIDSLDGIELTVLHPVLDEAYPDDLAGPDPYAYYRLYIPAGPQHLDGKAALEYVRSRHGDLQSDFGRSARQQQVLLAIKSLMEDPAMVGRVPHLVTSLQDAVRTDLTVPAIAQLALLGRGVSQAQIHRQILSAPRFARIGTSPDGHEQVVLPNWEAIRPEMAKLLRLHAPEISEALAEQVWQEEATVQVLNGSTEPNLARDVSDYLAWQGFRVVPPANADRADHPGSEVLVHDRARAATAQALADLLRARIVHPPAETADPAITVIVGRDHPPIPVPDAR